jgi:V/A-type H+-transporting ATPase subunit A
MVPPQISGTVVSVAAPGKYTVDQEICKVKTPSGAEVPLMMMQRWPVRQKRPVARRLPAETPLVTGQRVVDCMFPMVKGGAAAIPGGFGTGKTITQHQLAKWSDADLIVYIGCGERGNEMTEVLVEFPKLIDPHSNRPLMERTILIANTSDMPVAAREASIYTGITLAEYYRDMGYHVALMADSTSRWAEALRELSGRLEEMPAEEGFPAYLATRLAEFYERAGMVEPLGGGTGSVSVIGAVSPAGGDFSEPVTQHTSRFIGCFWALDKELASARYYPSINYINSHSSYVESVAGWWKKVGGETLDWQALREETVDILRRDDKLQQIVKLVGEEELPDEQKLILDTARILQNAFLQQSAYDDIDTYSVPEKQLRMLSVILHYYHRGHDVVKRSMPIYKYQQLEVRNDIMRMKSRIPNDQLQEFDALDRAIDEQVDALIAE